MYILIVSRGYPTKKSILNGIFEFDQAKALQNLGHKVIFASIDLRSIRRWRKWGSSYKVKDNIEIYNCSIPLGRFPWWILLFFGKIALYHTYLKIKQSHGRPDIIHSHFSSIGSYASILKKKFDLPIVITEHSSTINKDKIQKKALHLGRIAFSNSEQIVSVSSALSKKIKQHFGLESVIIPNIVDTSLFQYCNSPTKNSFKFISVGNLIPSKGHDKLIQAYINAKFNNNVYLEIIGDGSQYEQLQYQIEKANLKSQIKLWGKLKRSEIAQIMKQCNVFVLASETETFGLAYIEAIASGLPVIATACGGPEDFVKKQNGILIPVNNIEELTKALLQIYHDIDNFNNKKISEQCKSDFSPEIIAKRLTKIYQEILNKQN